MAAAIGDLIERFYVELWNNWNDSAVPDVLHPGFTFRGSLGQETLGRDGWRRYRDLIRSGSADFHNEIVELVCDGQRAAARLRYTGTHTGTPCWDCRSRDGALDTQVRLSSPPMPNG